MGSVSGSNEFIKLNKPSFHGLIQSSFHEEVYMTFSSMKIYFIQKICGCYTKLIIFPIKTGWNKIIEKEPKYTQICYLERVKPKSN